MLTWRWVVAVVVGSLVGLWCLAVRRVLPSPGATPTYTPLGPSSQPSTAPPLDDLDRLIDLPYFHFLSEHGCNHSQLVIVLVHSSPRNTFNRRMIRQTWGKHIPVLFLLGESSAPVEEEEYHYGDIIRGSFHDSYRNLTYKHVMGLKWVTYKCPNAKYILKTDDDVFVDVAALTDWLRKISPHGATGLLACKVQKQGIPRRSYRSKWRVTPKEFPGYVYPVYCFGWAILYSQDVAQALYLEAQKSSYFWIDDVQVTGVLASRANISHTNLDSLAVSDESAVSSLVAGYSSTPFLFVLTTPDTFPNLTYYTQHY